jgi:nucleotide-binding universal stress UspA family protein
MVPLDGTTFSEYALTHALAIAKRLGSAISLLMVETPPPLTFPMAQLTQPLRELEVEYLDQVAERARVTGVSDVSVAVVEGDVPYALEAHRSRVGATLTVMSTHGRAPLARAWLGSVADRFVRLTEAPTLMVRPGETVDVVDLAETVDFDHILVTLDGSPLSESALEPALELGRPWGAKTTVAHLTEYPRHTESVYLPDAVEAIEHTLEEGRAKAEAELNTVVGSLVAAGHVTDRISRVVNHIAEGIIECADEVDADAIVMASHGRGGVRRLALGSVTDKVLRGTERPVLIIPGKPD